MADKPLTMKQEAFAQALAGGANQSDAYRGAYSTERMAAKTIWSRASELAAESKVAARVAELREALAKKQLWTREKSVAALLRAYKKADDGDQAAPMVSAVRELNAMHGFNAPVRHEISTITISTTDGEL